MVRSDDGLIESNPSDTIKTIAAGMNAAIKTNLQKLAVVISPKLTNEEVYTAYTLFRKNLNLPNLDHNLPIKEDWVGDDLLRSSDPLPNRLGCEWIKFVPLENGVGINELEEAILRGKIDTLLTIVADPRDFLSDKALRKLKRKYYILRNLPEGLEEYIDAVLPATAWSEYRGTFTNFEGRVQKLEKAYDALGKAQPVWHWLLEISTVMKKSIKWKKLEDIANSLSENIIYFKGIHFDKIDPEGVRIGENK